MAGAGARAEYTPGPWSVQHANSGVRIVQEANSTGPKAKVICSGLAGDRANARLIAAAPDMLAALQEIRSLLMAEGASPLAAIENALVPLDAAIAKATGAA